MIFTCIKIYFISLFAIILSVLHLSCSTKVQMKIVKETANYGYFGNEAAENNEKLIARIKPANFSGPALLKLLIGKCFSTTLDKYRYNFCPFQNITQHEKSVRWNSYQGVLGVWSHWKIKNNTFASMIFTHGDECGDINRKVEVQLKCGMKEILQNVTEPEKCAYIAIFQTRYVCHDDALLVYPRLNATYQHYWDKLWTKYQNGFYTEKGYLRALRKMFYEIGLEKPVAMPVKKNEKSSNTTKNDLTNAFSDLETCNSEYDKMKQELVSLTEELNSLKLFIDINRLQERHKFKRRKFNSDE